jgi:hypothetical protein
MTPIELLARLAALVPPPRHPLLTYYERSGECFLHEVGGHRRVGDARADVLQQGVRVQEHQPR